MIPFLNLKKINAPYEKEFKQRFDNFLKSGWYVLGEEVALFEKEYAVFCGTSHCVGTANGLDAIRIILEGYKILKKIDQGDQVLVASNTYIATIIAIKQAGLIPVLIEVNEQTFNFDYNDLEAKITVQTKVILPTHLYGQLTDMEKVSAFAKANNLLIITDCAQSHGAQDRKENKSGSLANAAAHSFYPTKNLGALGDAGAITTNDTELAEVVKKYRNYGFEKPYVATYIGINSRLDELQAAFLRIKLRSLDSQNRKRIAIAKRYLTEIKNEYITLPKWKGQNDHVFHLFVIRSKYRDALQAYLKEEGIHTIIHYPIPPHKQEALVEFKNLHFPVCERLHNEVLSISSDPTLINDEVDKIIRVINSFVC